MNLAQALILSCLFLSGVGICGLLSLFFQPLSDPIYHIASGAMFILLFTWRIFKKLSMHPTPPTCVNKDCRNDEYEVLEGAADSYRCICSKCGYKFEYNAQTETAIIHTNENDLVGHFGLRFPKFIGRWKRKEKN